ncbi:MAG: hypothetical protein WC789_01375 [Lentisphaeria bacterium]|jgi:hypothetical protein
MNRTTARLPLLALPVLLLLAGCMGGERITGGPAPIPARPALTVAAPLRVMVMPLAVAAPAAADDADPGLGQWLTAELAAAVDARPALFRRVPLPTGPEADEVVRQTARHAAGLLPPAAFARLRGFGDADRFLYGQARVEPRTTRRPGKADLHQHAATVTLRLVDGQTLTYTPLTGEAAAADPRQALRLALAAALARLAPTP